MVSVAVRAEAIKLLETKAQGKIPNIAQVRATRGEAFGDRVLKEFRRIGAITTSVSRGDPGDIRRSEEFQLAQAARRGTAGRIGRTSEQFLSSIESGRIVTSTKKPQLFTPVPTREGIQTLQPPIQTLAPPDFVPTFRGEGTGSAILKRTEAEERGQQSLPLGTIAFIPSEDLKRASPLSLFNIRTEQALTDLGVPRTIREGQERLISKLPPELQERLTAQLKLQEPEFLGGIGEGAFQFIRQEPLTVATIGGGGILFGVGLKGLGFGAARLSGISGFGKAPTVLKFAEIGTGVSLLGIEGLRFGTEFLGAPGPGERGELLGREFVTLGAFVGGAGLGGRIGRSLIGRFETRGLKLIPFEDITVQEPFAQAPRGTTAQQLAQQFRQQRVVTAQGIDKFIRLPGEIPGEGINVFTASLTGPRGQEFASLLGRSREPGPFFAPQLSKEFLGKGGPQQTFFGLDTSTTITQPIAFRFRLGGVERLPKDLLKDVIQEGPIGFKGFASPSQQRIISFRAEQQDPFKAIISTRFELGGGEIEALGRAGAVARQFDKPLFTITPSGQRVLIPRVELTGEIVEPKDLIRRARGTAIVRTPRGILLTFAPEEKAFILPGGGADIGESIAKATSRELFEETGLRSLGLVPLGSIEGPIKRFGTARRGKNPFRFVKETFEVFNVDVRGVARPKGEVEKIAFFTSDFKGPLTPTTRDILKLAGEDVGRIKFTPPKSVISQKDLSGGKLTVEDFFRTSERSFGGSRQGIITPLRFVGSRLTTTRRKGRPMGFSEGVISPRRADIFRVPFVGFPTSLPPSLSRSGSIPPIFSIVGPPPPPEPPVDPFGEPLRRGRKREKLKKLKKKKRTRRGFVGELAPSFTAIVQELRGQFPEELRIGTQKVGISPLQIRVLPRLR